MTYIQTRAEQMDTATLQRGSPCVGMILIFGVYIGWIGCAQSAHIHSGFPRLSELQPHVTLATSSWASHCISERDHWHSKACRKEWQSWCSTTKLRIRCVTMDDSFTRSQRFSLEIWPHILGNTLRYRNRHPVEKRTASTSTGLPSVWSACLKGVTVLST